VSRQIVQCFTPLTIAIKSMNKVRDESIDETQGTETSGTTSSGPTP
jgi:hypothetical protein